MSELYLSCFNFVKTCHNIQLFWRQNLASHMSKAHIYNICTYVILTYIISHNQLSTEEQLQLVQKLLPSFTVSKQLVHDIIQIWWSKLPSGREAFLTQRVLLCQTTGRIVRIDHTYKFVKCVGVTDGADWVCCTYVDLVCSPLWQIQLRCSVFSILNAVRHYICYKYICINNIYSTAGRKSVDFQDSAWWYKGACSPSHENCSGNSWAHCWTWCNLYQWLHERPQEAGDTLLDSET